MIKSIFTRKSGEKVINCDDIKKSNLNTKKVKNKTPLKYLMRELVWLIGKWNTFQFNDWLESFNPDAVLLQAGDTPFMYKITRYISYKFNIPIIIYNTEDYYFKEYNYIQNRNDTNILYKCFHYHLKKEFEKTIYNAKLTIYNCDSLKDDYDKVFKVKSVTIMNSSDINIIDCNSKYKNKFLYVGNLGLKRYKSLIDLSHELRRINENYYIDVYGKSDDVIKEAFEKEDSIHYKGVISYEDVIKKMMESEYLVHVESFDDFYAKDLKNAFSTKIADYVCSLKTIICYSPATVSCYKYIEKNRLGITISCKENAYDILRESLNNNKEKEIFKTNQKIAKSNNHNLEKNSIIFSKLIMEVLNEDTTSK